MLETTNVPSQRAIEREITMTRFQKKAQGQVKQMVGQMTGDHRLEQEGREQLRKADDEQAAENADQGIARDQKGEEQPKDEERARTVHKPSTDNSVSREKTRDPKARKGPLLD